MDRDAGSEIVGADTGGIPSYLGTSALVASQTPPASSGELANPSLGIGLNGIDDASTQSPFLDVFHSARLWTGHIQGQYGRMEFDALQAAGALDADGWPILMPTGIDHIGTVFLTDLPAEMTSAAGRYRLTYEGAGNT